MRIIFIHCVVSILAACNPQPTTTIKSRVEPKTEKQVDSLSNCQINCFDSVGKKTGVWITYYETENRIKEKAFYKNGKLNGVLWRYNGKGEVETKASYKDGFFDGEVLLYVSGRVYEVQFYRKGRMEYLKMFDADSNIIKAVYFDSTGIKIKSEYKD